MINLPLLSGTLKKVLEDIHDKHNDRISEIILKANNFIEDIRKFSNRINSELLDAIEDEIVGKLITDEVRMLSCRTGGNELEVSFLPKGREPEYTSNGSWGRSNRQTGKPARIFQRLLKEEFKQKDWEDFSNNYKAEVCNCADFELVSGEDIRYWYNQDHYYNLNGTLGNSCMKYSNCGKYMDIYVDNAKMLITKKDGLLTGRAIVWELGDVTILDRIYTCFDYLTNCFIDYAKDHGWWIRENNGLLSTGDKQYWYTPDDGYKNYTDREFKLTLPKKYKFFPYVDSFRYFNVDSLQISTSSYSGYNGTLDSTDGCINGCETYICANCGREMSGYDDDMPDGMHYSEYADEYYCDECCWYSDYYGDWFPNDVATTPVHIMLDETIEAPESYFSDDFVRDPNGSEHRGDIIEINGEYYFYECRGIQWNSTTNAYELCATT